MFQSKFISGGISVALLAFAAACAPKAPPPPIYGEATYNKYGEPTGCVGGYVLTSQMQCVPPGQGCVDVPGSAPCDPQYPGRQPDPNGGRGTGQSATGGTP